MFGKKIKEFISHLFEEKTVVLKPGDIITFNYNKKYKGVKAIYKGEYRFGNNPERLIARPIFELLEEISYTSTHHSGETFRKGREINFLDHGVVRTINGEWVWWEGWEGEKYYIPIKNEEEWERRMDGMWRGMEELRYLD